MRASQLESLPYVRCVNGKPQVRVEIPDHLTRCFPSARSKTGYKTALTKRIRNEHEYGVALEQIRSDIDRAEQGLQFRERTGIRDPWIASAMQSIVNHTGESLRQMLQQHVVDIKKPDVNTPLGTPITTAKAIDYLVQHNKVSPKPRALRAKAAVMTRLFEFLDMPDDLAVVTTQDLQRFKEHLVKTVGNTTARHILYTARRLFALTWANNHDLGPNPFDKILLPPNGEAIPRLAFSADEARTIFANLESPVVEWGHKLGALAGLITSEIFDAGAADVLLIDDMPCFFVRPDNRPLKALKTPVRKRIIPLHASIADDLMARARGLGGNGPLFPEIKPDRDGLRSVQASALLNRYLRRLGIHDEVDENGATIGLRSHRSWRKWFICQLEDMKDLKPARQRYLAGHTGSDVHERNYLEHPPEQTRPFIDRIVVPK